MGIDFFFSLLRSALWGTTVSATELTHKQYAYLKHLASRQTVEGLMDYAMMDKHNGIRLLDRQDVFDVYGMSQRIAKNNAHLNSELSELNQLLSSNGIPFFVVKGQTIAMLMAHPETRTPGDIDFYIPPSHFQQAKELIASEWQITYEHDEDEGEQHLVFSHNGIILEMHYCLLAFASGKNQKFFDSIIEEQCSISNSQGERANSSEVTDSIPTLSPEVNLLYTFLHLYHHLVELGCGLRQFCDMAVLCRHYHTCEDFDTRKLAFYLERMDFTPAFRATETILVDYLGLPENECPVRFTDKDRKYASAIMKIVFQRGNFGKYGRKTTVRSGMHYYIEQTGIKLEHYRLFYHLSRREVLASTFLGIPKKVLKAIFPRTIKSNIPSKTK